VLLDSDPQEGMSLEQLGNMSLQHPLDLDHSPGTAQSGDMALVYNSRSVHVRPVVQAVINSPNNAPMASSITLQLTWDGTPQNSQVFTNFSGFNPGDVMIASAQVPSSVAVATGRHKWQLAVTIATSAGNYNYSYAGATYVVAQDGSPFGPGWTLSAVDGLFPIYADPVDPTDYPAGVLFVYGTGGARFFKSNYPVNGVITFTGPPIDNGTLTASTSTGVYTYTRPDGSSEVFNPSGNETAAISADGWVTAVTDALNRTTTYTLDSLGYTTQEQLPDGHTVNYGYQGLFHALTLLTDENSHSTSYSYDSQGHLTQVKDAANDITAYGYDQNTGLLTTVTDPLNHTTTFAYDSSRRLTLTTEPLWVPATLSTPAHYATVSTSYDANGNVSTVTDALARVTTSLNDPLGRVTETINALGGTHFWNYDASALLTQETDERGTITSYVYDTQNFRGLLTSKTVLDSNHNIVLGPIQTTYDSVGRVSTVTDPYSGVTSYGYDSVGRVTAVKDPDGGVTQTQYDLDGEVTSRTDPTGVTTNYTYTIRGWVASLSEPGPSGSGLALVTYTYAYDFVGNVTGVGDPLGHTTQTTYDAVNRVSTVTDALTQTTTTMYDAAGNVTLTIDPRNVETAYTYDALNRLSTVTDAYASGSLARTTTYTLDAVGNEIAVTDPVGHAVTTSFDALNRPTLIQDAFGQVTSTTYDAGGAVSLVDDGLSYRTTYKLDALGRATRTIDANGNYTAQAFDADGRMVSSTDGMSDTSQTVYDAAGRVVQQIDPGRFSTFLSYDKAGRLTSVTDPVYNTTSDRYDQSGRLTQQTDQQGHSDTYLYDAGGRQTSHLDRDGRQDLYSYDADNRLTAVTWKDANGTTVNQQAYTYDPNGNVLTAGDNNGTYTYTYDILNRAITEQEPFGVALSYVYDAADKLSVMHDSFGGTATYTFDNADRLAAVQFSATVNGATSEQTRLDLGYDNRDALVGETRSAFVSGQLAQVGNSNFYYDYAGRLTTISDTKAGGTISLDNFHYGYDQANRVTSEATAYTGATKTYTYDADSQVKSDGSSNFTYDANGNRTNNGFSTPPASSNELFSDGTWIYTYDNAGNLIQKANYIDGVTTWKYQYDNANRLTQAAEYTGGSAAVYKETYKYDVYGNRLETDIYLNGATTPTTITRSAFDPWGNAFADFDTTLHGSARRLSLPALDAVFARFDGGGATWWNLTDHQGSVRDVMGNNQTIADHVEYTTFGTPSESATQGFADRYFNGQVWDGTTGLLHQEARDSDPNTGRFLQQDPLGLRGDINLYRNVGNDPANFSDLTGEQRAHLDAAALARMNAASASSGRGSGRGGLVDLSPWGQTRTILGAIWDGQYQGGVAVGRGAVNAVLGVFYDVPLFFVDSGRTLYYGARMGLNIDGPETVLSLQYSNSRLTQGLLAAERQGPQASQDYYAQTMLNMTVAYPWYQAIDHGIRTGDWDPYGELAGGLGATALLAAGGQVISGMGPVNVPVLRLGGGSAVLAADGAPATAMPALSVATVSVGVSEAGGVLSGVAGLTGPPMLFNSAPGVQPYEVDTYGNLRARSLTGDGLDLDHQPSNASNIARAEAEFGRPLTEPELIEIRDQGTAVAVPQGLHRGTSPTFGGRNTPAQIAADAANPLAAVIRDTQAMIDAASVANRAAAEAAAVIIRGAAGG
jgi:RHS repeat-associated protein